MVISVCGVDAEEDLGFQRLDAENDELLARQPLREALLIELVLVRGEAQQAVALVSDSLPRTLGPEPGQIPLESAQGLPSQVGLLLDSHGLPPFPFFSVTPMETPKSYLTRNDLTTSHPLDQGYLTAR